MKKVDHWQIVHLLICSAEHDMYAEREYLVKYVWPNLREWCQQWKLHLIDHDVYPQANEDIFEQVGNNDCNIIYFLLFGNKWQWLNICDDFTIKTFLSSLEKTGYPLFYFRSPASFPSVGSFSSWQTSQCNLYQKTFLDRETNFTEFKEKIYLYYPPNTNKVRNYDVEFATDLSNPENNQMMGRIVADSLREFGQKITDDIKNYISQTYQQRISTLWEKQQAKEQCFYDTDNHQAFAAIMQNNSYKREDLLKKLIHYLNNDSNKIFLIYGYKGVGKSSLLTSLYHHLTQPKTNLCAQLIVIPHFVEACSQAHSFYFLLFRLCHELKQHYQLSFPVPKDIKSLMITFDKFLTYAQTPTAIIIDGLESVEATEKTHTLHWLPNTLPANIKIIVSVGEKLPAVLLEKANKNSLRVPFLSKHKEVRAILYNNLYNKNMQIPEAEIQLLLEKEDIVHPFYLQQVIQELRSINSLPQLRQKIQKLPNSIVKLFLYTLNWLKQNYDHNYPHLVETIVSLLSCSRYGLSIEELRGLLVEVDENDTFLIILRQLRPYLSQREKLFYFSSKSFAYAVKEHYLSADTQEWHTFLAEYFEQQPLFLKDLLYQEEAGDIPNTRKLIEQSWQKIQSGDWQSLLVDLCCLEFIEAKSQAGMITELQNDYQRALTIAPKEFSWELAPGVYIDYQILSLLEHTLKIESQFLQSRSKHLFQVLWNYCYWHDCPETAKYYKNRPQGPWLKNKSKLYKLAQYWENHISQKTWIKSLRPLPIRLDSNLVKILRTHEHKDIRVNNGKIKFLKGNRKILVGTKESLEIWDIHSGEVLYTFQVSQQSDIAVSHRGDKIASVTHNLVKTWNTDGEFIRIFENQQLILTTAFHPDGEHLLFVAVDRITIVQIHSQKTCVINDRATLACFTDKNHIISTGKKISLWNIVARKCIYTWNLYGEVVHCILMSPDGKMICLIDESLIKIWDLKTKELLHTITCPDTTDITLHTDGDKIISASYDHHVYIWDIKTGKKILTLAEHENWVDAVSCSANGKLIASITNEGELYIWKPFPIQPQYKLQGHNEYINKITFSPDNTTIISTADSNINLWDAEKGNLITSLSHYSECLCLSADNKYLIYGSDDKKIRIYNLKTRKIVRIQSVPANINSIAISPNNSLIAYGCIFDIHIWDIKKGHCIKLYGGHDFITSLCFNANGDTLVSGGGQENTVRVWNTYTGSLEMVFFQHKHKITTLAFSTDKKIASGSNDHTINIWNSSGELLYNFTDHTNTVLSVAFNDDGTRLASSSEDGTIRIWDLQNGKCIASLTGKGDVNSIVAETAKIPYIVLTNDKEITILDKKHLIPIVHFPGLIESPSISKNNTIIGHTGKYVYILKLLA